MAEKVKINGQAVELKHLDKIYYPKSKITKKQIIEYYKKISKYMLPYMKDRPLVMQRFPGGIASEGFYAKEVPDYFPKWINRVNVKKKTNGKEDLVICNNTATLVYLANQGCITMHLWLSKKDKIDYPDQIIFDLDPPKGKNFKHVAEAAFKIKEEMEKLGLKPYAKTTGSKGLHVVIPIKPELKFDTVRKFASDFARKMAKKYPDKYTTNPRKEKRKGKIFLDYLRNSYAQTAVAPFSARPYEGAPVAAPVTWQEIKKINSQTYNIKNIFKKGDVWKGMERNRKSLKTAISKLNNSK